MIVAIQNVRQQIALKRVLRRQESSYLQIRHYLLLKKDRTAFGARYNVSKPARQICPSPVLMSHARNRDFFTSVPVLSSLDNEDDGLRDGVEISEYDEGSFGQNVSPETEDDLAHLRVKLYKVENDPHGEYLERLYEAASIQQVFDVVEDQEKREGKVNSKVASQALVTVWDLQKLLFMINANFDPERDFFDRPSFIEKVSRHPVFLEKIVKPVVENCEALEDEPLLATLLCLKRMNYDIRGAECQKFVEECLRRKETISLPSISRLFVCMRDENLYGLFVSATFYPLLFRYIDEMSSDLDVRLAAISLRNSVRLASESIIDKFRTKIDTLINDLPNWETVTVCKVFLVLMTVRSIGSECKHVYDIVGEELAKRVPDMQLMDVLSLQKFLDLGFIHPYSLVEALVSRMLRIVQEGVSSSTSPRLDLLASVAPHLKSAAQRRQLALMLQDYLEKHKFDLASGILFVILRWAKSTDIRLYNLFWNKAAEMVANKTEDNIFDRRILKLARDYLNFTYGLNFGYRHKHFEYTVKRYFYGLIDNYAIGVQPCVMFPNDFARCFAFLLGCATLSDPILYDIEMVRMLDDFSLQFRSSDLVVLSRGLESVIVNLFYPRRPAAKYYDRVLEICSILEEQCSRILINMEENVEFGELLAIHKSALVTRKVKGDSPLLDLTMQRVVQRDVNDFRSMKDLAQHLLNGWNNYPEATQKIEDFIWNSKKSAMSPELIEKFVTLAFCLGWETSPDRDVFGLCSEILTKDWEKLSFLSVLQSSLGLCYFRRMSKELVQNIFSVEFLDQMDAELASTYRSNQYPLRLRQSMMELNRAVCIDMPDVNLPWFHEKFCEELLVTNKLPETYLHKEVRKVLAEVVGDDAAVQSNICSPYYYHIDFLIEFDEKSRPIKKNQRIPTGFFQKFRENKAPVVVGRKVAVLILTSHSFTRSVRSLKGQLKLRRRHLEILGYDVVEIDPIYWNSMFMSENSVRQNFLESKLYASASAVG